MVKIINEDWRDRKFIEEDNALDHIDSTTKQLLIDMARKATSPNFVEAWISRDYLKSTGSYRLILNIKIAHEYEGSGNILSSVSRKFDGSDVWWDDMSVIQVDVTDWFEDANLTESATQALHHYIDDDGYVSIENVANFITDAYDGELDDRYSCIASIIHDHKDEGKVSTEVIDQYAGAHNLVDQDYESVNEDWRDGKFTKEDLDKYISSINDKVDAIGYSLTKMAEKHPEFSEEFLSEVKAIRNKFDHLSLII